MSAKATPGLWAESQGVIFAKGGVNIAHVNSHNTTEGRANALLLAAAPAMLEALTDLLAEYVDLFVSGELPNWDPEKEAHVIAARAAISRGRGAVTV